MRSPCGPKPEDGQLPRMKPAARSRTTGWRAQQAADRRLDAAERAAGGVAERQRRRAAGDRHPLAVAERAEAAAFLGGESAPRCGGSRPG